MVLNILLLYILGYVIAFSTAYGYYKEDEPIGMKKHFIADYLGSILLMSLLSWILIGIVLGEIRSKLNQQ